MKAPLEVLKTLNIPTNSFLSAVAYINGHDDYDCLGDLTKEEYEAHTAELIGLTAVPEYENYKTSRIYFGYAVQETVRAFNTGVPLDMEKVWEEVNTRAAKFIQDCPWAIKDYETELDENGEQKLDAAGNPKQRKGAKKDMAKKVWAENQNVERTRKEWIALLCEEVGLTPAGASTYYANLKKGVL